MGDTLTLAWRLDIEVLTPVHIGTGTKLTDGYDFVTRNGKTYRLNVDAILDAVWPDDPRQQAAMLKQDPGDLLRPEDFVKHPEFFAYALAGIPQGAKREVSECIKDAQGRPYIPGSTLKGAFRTALLASLETKPLSRVAGGNPKKAAAPAEEDWFGRSPHTDILRALHVADSEAAPQSVLRLQPIQMVPGLVVNVEAMGPGAKLQAEVRLDTWLLGQQGARGLRWKDEAVRAVQEFLDTARDQAGKRLYFEYSYHVARHKRFHGAEDEGCLGFYAKIIKRLLDPKSRGFPLQIGFATGWRAKTILGTQEDKALASVIRQFSLDRGGRGRGGSWQVGQPFPKARHVALMGEKRFLPVGWVWICYTRID